MNNYIKILMVVLLCCLVGSNLLAVEGDGSSEDIKPEITALDFVNYLIDGEYETAVKLFDSTLKNAMPVNKLEGLWNQLTSQAQLGEFQEILGIRTEEITQDNVKYDIMFISSRFEKEVVDFQLVVNPQGEIAGLFVIPSEWEKDQSLYQEVENIEIEDDNRENTQEENGTEENNSKEEDENNEQAAAELPAYIDKETFVEKEVIVGTEWPLPGILTLPIGEGPFPGVVLVHGSGPNDRDETLGPNKPFRDLAWGLASKGIAVLRYDKRTLHYQNRINEFDEMTVWTETIDDAIIAVEMMANRAEVDDDNIYVLGHSLGGYLLPRIANNSQNADGFVILAGSARPIEDLIFEQYEYILGLDGLSDEDKTTLNALEQLVQDIKGITEEDLEDNEMYLNMPVEYLLDLQDYQPVEEAKKIERPVLILQGERDYNVTMEDFGLWQEGLSNRDNVDFITYPALDHLLMEGEGKCTPQQYMQKRYVDSQVVEDIAEWINK